MIHLYLAHALNPNGCGDYFVGCLAPDYYDKTLDKTKGTTHLGLSFSDNPTDNVTMDTRLAGFYAKIDKNSPFDMGYLTHLLCDWWYYDYIRVNRLFENNDDLISDWRAVGRQLRLNAPWVKDVFMKMAVCSDNLVYPFPDYTVSEVIAYKDGLISPKLRQKDEAAEQIAPKIHTSEFLGILANDITEKYAAWIDKQNKA
jgi:hypothetical protein